MIKKRITALSEKLAKFDKKYPTKEAVTKAKENGVYQTLGGHDDTLFYSSETPNLVCSVATVGEPSGGELVHYPVLDMDFPVYAVPSRTPGHTHLYIDKAIPHKKYMKLLDALADAGLLEPGYVGASKAAGKSFLRIDSYNKLLELEKKHEQADDTPNDKEAPTSPTAIPLPKHKGEVYKPTQTKTGTPWYNVKKKAKEEGYLWSLADTVGGYTQLAYPVTGEGLGLGTLQSVVYSDLPDEPQSPSTKAPEFTVGDKVEVVKCTWNPFLLGKLGTVVAVNHTGNWFGNSSNFCNQTIVVFNETIEGEVDGEDFEYLPGSPFGFTSSEIVHAPILQSKIEQSFNVGDIVEIANPVSGFYKKVGTIINIMDHGALNHVVELNLENNTHMHHVCFNPAELSLAF